MECLKICMFKKCVQGKSRPGDNVCVCVGRGFKAQVKLMKGRVFVSKSGFKVKVDWVNACVLVSRNGLHVKVVWVNMCVFGWGCGFKVKVGASVRVCYKVIRPTYPPRKVIHMERGKLDSAWGKKPEIKN